MGFRSGQSQSYWNPVIVDLGRSINDHRSDDEMFEANYFTKYGQ